VPAHELLVDPAGSLGEAPGAALLEEEGQEDRLEEKVAELVEELRVVARLGRVGDLVGLLDRVGHDRPRRLRPVPGTVAPQALGQPLEIDERGLEAVAAAHAGQPVVVAPVTPPDEVVVGAGRNPAA
jgi:hypothetical protein